MNSPKSSPHYPQNQMNFLSESLISLYKDRQANFLASLETVLKMTGHDPYIEQLFEEKLSANYVPKRILEIISGILSNDREKYLEEILYRISLSETCFGKDKQHEIEQIGAKLLDATKKKNDSLILKNYKEIIRWLQSVQNLVCSRAGLLPPLGNPSFVKTMKLNLSLITKNSSTAKAEFINFSKSVQIMFKTSKKKIIRAFLQYSNTTVNKKEANTKIATLQNQLNKLSEKTSKLQKYCDECQSVFGKKDPKSVLSEKDQIIDDLQSKINEMNLIIEKAQTKINNMKEKARQFRDAAESMMADKQAKMEFSLSQIINEKNSLLSENSQMKNTIQLSEQKMSSLIKNNKELKQSLSDLEKQSKGFSNELKNQLQQKLKDENDHLLQIQMLTNDNKSMKIDIQQLKEKNIQLQNQNQNSYAQIKQINQTLTDVKSELTNANIKCQELDFTKSKYESLQKQDIEKQNTIDKLNDTIQKTKLQLTIVNQKCKEQNDDIENKNQVIQKLSEQITALQAKNLNLESEMQRNQNDLSTQNQNVSSLSQNLTLFQTKLKETQELLKQEMQKNQQSAKIIAQLNSKLGENKILIENQANQLNENRLLLEKSQKDLGQAKQDLAISSTKALEFETKYSQLQKTMIKDSEVNENTLNQYKQELEQIHAQNKDVSKVQTQNQIQIRQQAQTIKSLENELEKQKDRGNTLDESNKELQKNYLDIKQKYQEEHSQFQSALKLNKDLSQQLEYVSSSATKFRNQLDKLLEENNMNSLLRTITETENIRDTLGKTQQELSDMISYFSTLRKENQEITKKFEIERKKANQFAEDNQHLEEQLNLTSQKAEMFEKTSNSLKEKCQNLAENLKKLTSEQAQTASISNQTIDKLEKALVKTQNELSVSKQNYLFTSKQRENLENELSLTKSELNQTENTLRSLQNDLIQITQKDSIADIPNALKELTNNSKELNIIQKVLKLDSQKDFIRKLYQIKEQSDLYENFINEVSSCFQAASIQEYPEEIAQWKLHIQEMEILQNKLMELVGINNPQDLLQKANNIHAYQMIYQILFPRQQKIQKVSDKNSEEISEKNSEEEDLMFNEEEEEEEKVNNHSPEETVTLFRKIYNKQIKQSKLINEIKNTLQISSKNQILANIEILIKDSDDKKQINNLIQNHFESSQLNLYDRIHSLIQENIELNENKNQIMLILSIKQPENGDIISQIQTFKSNYDEYHQIISVLSKLMEISEISSLPQEIQTLIQQSGDLRFHESQILEILSIDNPDDIEGQLIALSKNEKICQDVSQQLGVDIDEISNSLHDIIASYKQYSNCENLLPIEYEGKFETKLKSLLNNYDNNNKYLKDLSTILKCTQKDIISKVQQLNLDLESSSHLFTQLLSVLSGPTRTPIKINFPLTNSLQNRLIDLINDFKVKTQESTKSVGEILQKAEALGYTGTDPVEACDYIVASFSEAEKQTTLEKMHQELIQVRASAEQQLQLVENQKQKAKNRLNEVRIQLAQQQEERIAREDLLNAKISELEENMRKLKDSLSNEQKIHEELIRVIAGQESDSDYLQLRLSAKEMDILKQNKNTQEFIRQMYKKKAESDRLIALQKELRETVLNSK